MKHRHYIGALAVLLVAQACEVFPDPAEEARTLAQTERWQELARIKAPDASQTDASNSQAADDQASDRQTVIVQGSGDFIGTPAETRTGRAFASTDEGISLNLVDVSVEEAANTILGQILGRTFIVQQGVAGSITLQTSQPIPSSALLPILEDVLKAQGLALLQRGEVFQILPSAAGSPGGSAIVLRNGERTSGPGYQTVIRPLEFAPAADIAEILEQIGPAGRVLRADAARNLVVLTGTSQEIDGMLDTISLFDVDWLAGMSFTIVPVNSANPADIVREIEVIASEGAAPDGANESPFLSLVRLVPNERMGAIIVISPQTSYLRQAESWIRRLDNQASSVAEQLFLYNVQNAVAEDLALILQDIISGQAPTRNAGVNIAPGLQPVQIQRDGAEQADSPQLEIFPTLDDQAPDQRRTGLYGLEGVRIFPYEGRNALAITGTADQYRRVETMLKTLDIGANQVLLEATIVEVTLRDELSRGVRWFFGDDENEISFSDFATGAIAPSFPGFAYTFDDDNVRIAIDALEAVTDVNFLSSPSIMVLDNATATIQVGDQVPITTQSAVGVIDPGAPIVNSVSFRDTGVILTITPRVNDSGLVLLEIEQEVSDVVPTITSGIDSPTIQQRRIDTTVAVQDGSSLALGGLIEDSVSVTSVGVPFISRIPVLGELFKSQDNVTDRTELLIIITPRVIRNVQEAQDATYELRQRLRGITPFADRLRLSRDNDE